MEVTILVALVIIVIKLCGIHYTLETELGRLRLAVENQTLVIGHTPVDLGVAALLRTAAADIHLELLSAPSRILRKRAGLLPRAWANLARLRDAVKRRAIRRPRNL